MSIHIIFKKFKKFNIMTSRIHQKLNQFAMTTKFFFLFSIVCSYFAMLSTAKIVTSPSINLFNQSYLLANNTTFSTCIPNFNYIKRRNCGTCRQYGVSWSEHSKQLGKRFSSNDTGDGPGSLQSMMQGKKKHDSKSKAKAGAKSKASKRRWVKSDGLKLTGPPIAIKDGTFEEIPSRLRSNKKQKTENIKLENEQLESTDSISSSSQQTANIKSTKLESEQPKMNESKHKRKRSSNRIAGIPIDNDNEDDDYFDEYVSSTTKRVKVKNDTDPSIKVRVIRKNGSYPTLGGSVFVEKCPIPLPYEDVAAIANNLNDRCKSGNRIEKIKTTKNEKKSYIGITVETPQNARKATQEENKSTETEEEESTTDSKNNENEKQEATESEEEESTTNSQNNAREKKNASVGGIGCPSDRQEHNKINKPSHIKSKKKKTYHPRPYKTNCKCKTRCICGDDYKYLDSIRDNSLLYYMFAFMDCLVEEKYPNLYSHIMKNVPDDYRIWSDLCFCYYAKTGGTDGGWCHVHKDQYSIISKNE